MGGEIRIEGNQRLPNLEGLRSLKEIGETIRIANNPSLNTLSAIGSVQTHGGLQLLNNPSFSKCSEDYLLGREAFKKDRVTLLSHRVVREGWGADRKCAEPARKFHKLTQDVLDRALKQMAKAMSTLDQQLRMSMDQQESSLKKMESERAARDDSGQGDKSGSGPKSAPADESKKEASNNAFVMPSFGNDVGATLRSEKILEGHLTGPCVLKGKVRSAEERRRRCRVKRQKWRVTMKQPAFVYMLQSKREPLQRHIEFGPNPAGRMKLHNEGLIMETAQFAPWKMVLKRQFSSGHGAQEYVSKLRQMLEKQKRRRAEILQAQAQRKSSDTPDKARREGSVRD